MKLLIDCMPGEFYEAASGLFLLPTQNIPASTEITVGSKLPATCMFDIHFALVCDQRVGFVFMTRFEVKNGGAYLMTFLSNKGQATVSETLIKDENLVVYHFPNKGTLAISPLVNSEIENILTEQ